MKFIHCIIGQRTRSAIKWIDTVVTVLLLILWVVSGWWSCEYNQKDGRYVAMIVLGTFHVDWLDPSRDVPERNVGLFSQWHHWIAMNWWFDYVHVSGMGWRVKTVVIPLWLFPLLVSVPTGVIWWRDYRRPGPGQCLKCGYDLRGTSLTAENGAVCPECGAKAT